MGTHGWRSDRPLKHQLHERGYQFGFYQAVRLLEILYADQTPVGEGSKPDTEPVRFISTVSHNFPASEIFDVQPDDTGDDVSNMVVNFMGLAGCLGPLPDAYTELILERLRNKDKSLKDFLDIFNHRLISILYRVRKIYRPGFDFAHPAKSPFSRYFLSLMGLGTEGLQLRMAVKDQALLNYTALLSQKPRSMRNLELILSDYFKTPVKGIQLVGQWLKLDDDQLTRIGLSGQNQVLGQNALLGRRVWDQHEKFNLHFLSLSIDQFLEFLPPGSAYRPLYQITKFFSGIRFDFEFQLTLNADEVPRSRLSAKEGPRLGWTSWLRAGKKQGAKGEVRLSPHLLTQLKNDFGFDYERKPI